MDALSVAIFFYFREKKMVFSSKKTTENRIVAIMIMFSIFASYLLYNIFNLCILKNDYYIQKTYDQVTTSSPLRAERGNKKSPRVHSHLTDK